MKRLLPFAALIAVVAAASYITAPAFFSKERIKRAVVQELSQRAGRPVTFSGEPTVTLFPYLGFRLDKVVVANAPGLGEEPFAVMDSVHGNIRLLPLLVGRIEPGNVQLMAPRIRLTVDLAGRANWDIGGRMAGVPLDRQVASAVRRSADATLGRLTIVDGFVTYNNEQSGKSSELSAVNLKLVWRSPTDQALATGTMVWRGETIEVTGSLARPVDFFAGRISPATLAIRATPLRLSFRGSAYAASEMGLDGEISIATPSLRRALAWMGRGIGDGSTLGAASITAKAKAAGSSMTFSDAVIALDGNEAAGGVSVTLDGERPRFQGTLAFASLDVSPYLESFRAGLAGSSDWNPVAINLAVLRDMDLDFRLSARQVVIGDARIGPAAAAVVGADGRVSFDIGDLQIYGGNLRATLAADLTEPVIAGTLHASLNNVPTRTALANFAGVEGVDGTGSAVIEISGRADSWNALLRSAAGSASIKLVNCSITGIDISHLGEEPPNGTDGSSSVPAAATTFDSIAGTLSLSDGTIRTTDVVAEGRDYLVTLDGTASLLQPTIKARGTIALRGPNEPAGGAGRLEIPFVIGGSWLQPMISPDIDRILLRKETKPASAIGGQTEPAITARVP